MSEDKLVILNDTHAGARNSSDIFINYQSTFYEEDFFPYCLANNIKKIIHLGDYYEHRKYINFKALAANRTHFLDRLDEYGMTMDIIPGNHDVYYKSTNDLCSIHELMGRRSNVNVIMEPTVFQYNNLKLGLVPWINQYNYAETMEWLANTDATWIGAHLELIGFEMMKGYENTHGMTTDPFKRFDMVLTGHFHTRSKKQNIHYLGSQMEFTWSDVNDQKYFHVIDTKAEKLIPVKCKTRIFEKVIYDDTKIDYSKFNFSKVENKFVKVIVIKKNDPFLFDKFIDELSNSKLHELKIAENFDEFLGDNVSIDESILIEDTRSLLNGYIDNVSTDLEKDKLKGIMQEAYIEALAQDNV